MRQPRLPRRINRKHNITKHDEPCPMCGSENIYRVFRERASEWKPLEFNKGGIPGFQVVDGWRSYAFADHHEHQCRSCKHRWATRVRGWTNDRIEGDMDRAMEVFKLPVILPIYICHCDGGRSYTVIQKDWTRTQPTFCPFCGKDNAAINQHNEEWIRKLRAEGLAGEQEALPRPHPNGQTDLHPGQSEPL